MNAPARLLLPEIDPVLPALELSHCPSCGAGAVSDGGHLVCLNCGAGHVLTPAVGAIKPGRISCLVPACGRSWDPAKVGHGEMICARHWRCIPLEVRGRRTRANQLERKHPNNLAVEVHAALAWEACKRAAVSGGLLL